MGETWEISVVSGFPEAGREPLYENKIQNKTRQQRGKRLFGAGDLLLLQAEEQEELQGFDLYMNLAEESVIYGFGERFDGLHQRGRILTL